jgi:hypothetical protein
MNAEAAVSEVETATEAEAEMATEAEAETATEAEAEAANTEGRIICVNSGHIVRVEGNKCGGLQLASSMKNLYESSIHSSKSSVCGRSSGAGSQRDKPLAAVW